MRKLWISYVYDHDASSSIWNKRAKIVGFGEGQPSTVCLFAKSEKGEECLSDKGARETG